MLEEPYDPHLYHLNLEPHGEVILFDPVALRSFHLKEAKETKGS
jgi:hypothetical protein